MEREVPIPEGLQVISKPVGSSCNLNCSYCFYTEKKELLQSSQNKMSNEILETYIKNYIFSQKTPEVEFVWHGGEPTLLGIDFFKRAVKLQKKYKSMKKIKNTFQTNGIHINEEWCRFFKENDFLIGLSIDGPREIHDRYRKDLKERGSFEKVYKALKLLKAYDVEFNILACITRESSKQPLEVYNFFKDTGVQYIQFTPLVERVPSGIEQQRGQLLGGPVSTEGTEENPMMMNWTVSPKEYGNFLTAVFDEWIRKDVGKIFISNFEGALAQWFGNPSPSCIHARQCGKGLVLESDGNVYACDHYVYPEYKLGNILEETFINMAEVSIKNGFGREKEEKLSEKCRQCRFLKFCWGGCPKHRFVKEEGEKYGISYLCESYQIFFNHIPRYLKVMGDLLINGYPASYVMEAIKGPLVLKKKREL